MARDSDRHDPEFGRTCPETQTNIIRDSDGGEGPPNLKISGRRFAHGRTSPGARISPAPLGASRAGRRRRRPDYECPAAQAPAASCEPGPPSPNRSKPHAPHASAPTPGGAPAGCGPARRLGVRPSWAPREPLRPPQPPTTPPTPPATAPNIISFPPPPLPPFPPSLQLQSLALLPRNALPSLDSDGHDPGRGRT